MDLNGPCSRTLSKFRVAVTEFDKSRSVSGYRWFRVVSHRLLDVASPLVERDFEIPMALGKSQRLSFRMAVAPMVRLSEWRLSLEDDSVARKVLDEVARYCKVMRRSVFHRSLLQKCLRKVPPTIVFLKRLRRLSHKSASLACLRKVPWQECPSFLFKGVSQDLTSDCFAKVSQKCACIECIKGVPKWSISEEQHASNHDGA